MGGLTAFLSLLLILFTLSCAKAPTLNMERHDFNKHPQRIIWLQIAGFSGEHLAMLRFARSDSRKKTSFEQADCMGQAWSYNLYDLRPSSYQGFMAQALGTKNIAGDCSDF